MIPTRVIQSLSFFILLGGAFAAPTRAAAATVADAVDSGCASGGHHASSCEYCVMGYCHSVTCRDAYYACCPITGEATCKSEIPA
jgi:hypothetical protein